MMVERVRQLWASFPRGGVALRTAVAAGVAWFLAQLIPGPVFEYSYYAPLGAVVATSFTIAQSARDSFRAVLAIIIGGAVATGADVWLGPSPLAVAGVVFVGSLLAGWRTLGGQGVLAPTAALFVMVIGFKDPIVFIGSYAGLVLLGAVIGIGVTLCFPQMPVTPAQIASAKLRSSLIDQLNSLADGLEEVDLLAAEDWRSRRKSLDPALWLMRQEIHQMGDARRANFRARRYRSDIALQERQSRALDRVVDLIDDLALLVSEEERAGNSVVGLGPDLRPAVARALRELASQMATVDGKDTDGDWKTADRAGAAIASLAEEVRARQAAMPGDGLFVAGSIVTSLRRVQQTLAPVDDQSQARS